MATKYKKQSDGRYKARVWDGSYRDGEKHYVYLYSNKSSKDLENKVKEYEYSRKNGLVVIENSITIYEYALKWVDTYKGLKERATYNNYKSIINCHLSKFDVGFDYFTINNLQDIINSIANKPRTCRDFRLTIKQIGESAEDDKLLPKGATRDIIKRLSVPKYKPKEKRILTQEEKDKIKNISESGLTDSQKLFVVLLYYTGMRREEILALTTSDIKDGYIHVNKAYGADNGKFYLKATKSERGNRKIPIVDSLQSYLDALVDSDGELFTIKTQTAYRRFWTHIQAYFESDVNAHLFRHNFCTQLCYISVTDHTITTKKIAEILGDSEAMVISVYSHIIEEQEDAEKSIRNALKF